MAKKGSKLKSTKKLNKSTKSKVGMFGLINVSQKQLKKSLGVFFGIVILLLVLAKIPATSNLPVVSWVKSLFTQALSSREQTVFNQINQKRAQNGKPALVLSEGMADCMRPKARSIAADGSLSDGSDGKQNDHAFYPSAGQCAPRACSNWTEAFENLGLTSSNGPVVDGWMNSSTHRANMLSTATHAGVGVYYDANGEWWVFQLAKCPGGGGSSTPPAANYQLQNGSFEGGISDNVPFSSPRSMTKGVWYGYASGGGQTARVACSCAANVPGGGGSYVALVNDTSTGAFNSLSQIVDAMPGKTYELFAHSLLLNNGGSTNNYQRLYLTFLDSNYNRIGTGKYYNTNAGYYGWAGNRVVDQAPSNARYVEVFIYSPNDRGPSKYDWDKVTLSIQ